MLSSGRWTCARMHRLSIVRFVMQIAVVPLKIHFLMCSISIAITVRKDKDLSDLSEGSSPLAQSI